jgi:hypothetical protein
MIDVISERVLQAGLLGDAVDTDPARDINANTITWEKRLRR